MLMKMETNKFILKNKCENRFLPKALRSLKNEENITNKLTKLL